jgi:hypothetical protein
MNLPKYFQYLGTLTSKITPAILLISALPAPLLAQPSPIKISLEFPSGDSKGAPESTLGGGRRGISCITMEQGKPSLTALMPKRDNKSLTLSPTPEFYFYVPKTTTLDGKAIEGEFILRVGEDDVYQTNLTLPQQAGIVKLQIPPTAALKTGVEYKWFFSIVCNKDDRSGDEYTEGNITRTAISPSLNKALQQAAPLKQAEIYAKYNFWPETITKIAQLRTEKPKEWKELLKSVGLGVIAEEKVFDTLKLNPEP